MNEWIRIESGMEEVAIENIARVKQEAWNRGRGHRWAWREDGRGKLQPPRIVFTSLANGGAPAPIESKRERGFHLTTNFTVKLCIYTQRLTVCVSRTVELLNVNADNARLRQRFESSQYRTLAKHNTVSELT